MNMVPTEWSFGPFGYSRTGEERLVVRPRRSIGRQMRGLIFSHPWNGSAAGIGTSEYQTGLLAKLAENFVCVASDLGTASDNSHNTWGNAMGVSRIHEDRDYLVNTLGCASKVVVLGMSHGGCSAFAYCRDYPGNVEAAIGLEPAVELSSIRAYDTALQQSIDLAHGGFSSAINNANSPSIYAASISTNIPIGIWYAEDDAITIPSTQLNFKANRPDTELFSINGLQQGNIYGHPATGTMPTVGHGDPQVRMAQKHLTDWARRFAIV